MKVLIKSAKIIDPNSVNHEKKRDILIINGEIQKIGSSIQEEDLDRKIELKDLHVSTGWFDSSVNFGEPGFEERETISNGLITAAKSGFTAIALNPGTNPVIDNNGAVTSVLTKAKDYAVKMFPIGALTKSSEGKELAELYDMKKAGAIAFGDYKRPVMHPNLLKLALQYTQNFNGLVMSYPQDNHIAGKGIVNEHINSTRLGLKGIPALAEELHITRDLAILEYTGGKLHIPTISTAKSVELIREAKNKGLDVTCSVAIHNLILTDDLLLEFDTNTKVLPPLRTGKDVEAILAGLKEGVIDLVTSDHNPIDVEHKKVEFEHALYGTTGLETAFGTLNRLFDLNKTVKLLTKGRSLFGIEESQIEIGKKVNLTLFTPKGNYTFNKEHIISTSKNSIFLDSKMTGKVYGIISGNNSIISD